MLYNDKKFKFFRKIFFFLNLSINLVPINLVHDSLATSSGLSSYGGYSSEWKWDCYPEEVFKMSSSGTSDLVIVEWGGIWNDSELPRKILGAFVLHGLFRVVSVSQLPKTFTRSLFVSLFILLWSCDNIRIIKILIGHLWNVCLSSLINVYHYDKAMDNNKMSNNFERFERFSDH